MARYINLDDLLDEFPEFSSLEQYLDEQKLQMYREVRIDEDGNEKIVGYRFGEPWVAMALYTEGGFKTETEALKRWYQDMQKEEKK